MVKRGSLPVTQVLVQWAHTKPEDATWEDLLSIRDQFLEFPSFGPDV